MLLGTHCLGGITENMKTGLRHMNSFVDDFSYCDIQPGLRPIRPTLLNA